MIPNPYGVALTLRLFLGKYSRFERTHTGSSDASLQLNVKEPPFRPLTLFQEISLAYLHVISIKYILARPRENQKIQFWNMNEAAFEGDEEESFNLTNVVFKGCVAGLKKPRTFFLVPYLHAMWLLIATSASKWEPYYNIYMYEAWLWKRILVFFSICAL